MERKQDPYRATTHRSAHRSAMWYEIRVEPDYLKADLFNRETAEETREFLAAVATEARKHGCRQIFIAVHSSTPLFNIGQQGLFEYLKELGSNCRIALTGDSDELRLAHQYIESLAQRKGLNVRSFRYEQGTLNWFQDKRWLSERRRQQEPYGGLERRHPRDRRKSKEISTV
jgi:hypothetical protein